MVSNTALIDYGTGIKNYSPSHNQKEMQEGCLETGEQPSSPVIDMSGTQVGPRRHLGVDITHQYQRHVVGFHL